jgi:hypothetical protein
MSAIHGVVLDGPCRPVAGARAFYVSGPRALPEIAALSDADGRFVLEAPRPGLYCIGCASDADGSGEAEVEVSGNDVSVEVRLRR